MAGAMIRSCGGAIAGVVVLIAACGDAERAVTDTGRAPARVATDTARPNPPSGEVAPSAEVLALLQDDPDVDGTITQEEAERTLEEARRKAAVAAPSGPPVERRVNPQRGAAAPASDANAEWANLESAKRKKIEAWEQKLATTTVFVADASAWYHSAGCDELYRHFIDRDRILHRIYVGRPISLKRAAESSMSAHAACSPPSYDF